MHLLTFPTCTEHCTMLAEDVAECSRSPAFAGEREGDLPLQFKWAAPILGEKPWALVYKKMRCNRKKRHENEAA